MLRRRVPPAAVPPDRSRLIAALLGLVVMTTPTIARDDAKSPPSGRDSKGVEQKGPAIAPKARTEKGRTETVDQDETITIKRK